MIIRVRLSPPLCAELLKAVARRDRATVSMFDGDQPHRLQGVDADPSRGGRLAKKPIVDRHGRATFRWMRAAAAEPAETKAEARPEEAPQLGLFGRRPKGALAGLHATEHSMADELTDLARGPYAAAIGHLNAYAAAINDHDADAARTAWGAYTTARSRFATAGRRYSGKRERTFNLIAQQMDRHIGRIAQMAEATSPDFDKAAWDRHVAGLSPYSGAGRDMDDAARGRMAPYLRAIFGQVPAHEATRASGMASLDPEHKARVAHALGEAHGERVAPMSLVGVPHAVLSKLGDGIHGGAARMELRKRAELASALGRRVEDIQPPEAGAGHDLAALTRDLSGLRARAATDPRAANEFNARRMTALLAGHGDLERMTDGGAAHPVWGAHEVSAPDATYEHRSDAHGFGHWENINGRDHHRYSRADLEAKHGADAMRAAGNTPETVHARMERTLGRDVAAHRERILSALRAHDGREGAQHIGTGAGPLPLAHVARLASRLPGLEGHEPERDLSDATLDGIASGTSSEDAPRFHHEHAVRGVVREAAQSAWQDADGHPSNIRVRKHGQGWNVVHAPSEQVIAGGLATRRAATAAAKMLHARHGDLPEKPKDVIGRKGLPTTVQHLRDHVDTGVLDRAGAILEARDRDAAQRSAVSVAREALDQHNAKPPPTPGEFKVTPTRLSRAKGAARAAQFVSRDVSRPPLRHYHVQDGRAAATDGARLIRFPVDGHVDGFYAGHRDTDGRQRGERVPPEAIGWNYPDYREVIPATTQHTAVVDAAHARDGLQHLVALAGNDREAPVRLSRRDGQITAQSRHPVHGTNHAVLGHHPGDDFDVYLNGHYLHDALSGASGAVQLGVDDAVPLGPHKEPRPVKVDREDGEEHVIMPMREPLR